MGRILALDFGTKRTGIAWTDEMRISVNPLKTLHPDDAILFIQENKDVIDLIVLGMPVDSYGREIDAEAPILNFRNRLKNAFPEISLTMVDESYTSVEARQFMIRQGYKKKDRERKENIDMFAAAFILQRYLDMGG